ncbi:MAG: GNAT family N-acetyltransferase [Spongiibacteraceae bacterium]
MSNITHHSDKNCFILTVDSAEAILEYRLLPDLRIDFSHTFVPAEFRGKGLAEKLVRHGLAWAETQGLTVQASCWYVERFLT